MRTRKRTRKVSEMAEMLSLEDGVLAVRSARAIAEAETEDRICDVDFPETFRCDRGVFVTISEYPSGILRGCIGYPQPIMQLSQSLPLAARGACNDPRFPRLRPDQAKRCTFEVTVLTEPEPIRYKSSEDLKSQIDIGKDGLIMRYRRYGAVYLPQVPVEQEWNTDEYLGNLCMKAGMQEDSWKSGALDFEKFQGEVFSEVSPGGEVVRK